MTYQQQSYGQEERVNLLVSQPPVYTQSPPVYTQTYVQQPQYSPQVVVVDPHHHHHHDVHTTTVITVPEEDNCLLGFCMGCLFGIFGLFCLMCVRNQRSYLKGWIIPFVISLVLTVILVALFFAGVIGATHQVNNYYY